jgi:hypothetical protein
MSTRLPVRGQEPVEFASEPGNYPEDLRGQIDFELDGKLVTLSLRIGLRRASMQASPDRRGVLLWDRPLFSGRLLCYYFQTSPEFMNLNMLI